MKKISVRPLALLLALLLALSLCACDMGGGSPPLAQSFSILDGDSIEVALDGEYRLRTNLLEEELKSVQWTVSGDCVMVTEEGYILGIRVGTATVRGEIAGHSDSVQVRVVEKKASEPTSASGASASFDPYEGMTAAAFYENYTPADSHWDAYWRTCHNFMSGTLETPDQAPVLSAYRPTADGRYIRNTDMLYSEGGKAYTVTDAYGEAVFTVYEYGAYITLEEIAAYVFAFGDVPENYDADKDANPKGSPWGEYLRANHSYFSGDTDRFPYEPVLPNISGCGGTLYYYEIDIGTTGTDCDPKYPSVLYNNGNQITRGAARIVYGKQDLNGNGIYERGEHHVFYTYNHYNDFQEYLNYFGGWGETFGNITGGGSISSKYDYNPTDYIEVAFTSLSSHGNAAAMIFVLPSAYLKRAEIF